jgi:hypothetical protein
MLKDGVLETSFSNYVNPLTIVEREGKILRICIDARRVNALMIPDRVKVDPMKELLQNSMELSLSRLLTSAVLSFRFRYTDHLGSGPVFSLEIKCTNIKLWLMVLKKSCQLSSEL